MSITLGLDRQVRTRYLDNTRIGQTGKGHVMLITLGLDRQIRTHYVDKTRIGQTGKDTLC